MSILGAGATQVRSPQAALMLPDLLSHVGNTPLLEIRLARRDNVSVYGKAEFLNPGGSVKDRPALNMILEGEKSGQLNKDKTLIDSTSGNTGIAYAMVCAAKGYRAKLCLPANASPERIQILHAFGAELVLTDAAEGSDGALRICQQIYDKSPEQYFYPDQYSNPANWQAHYESTGPEIIEQTDGKVTHFLAAIGTAGTFVGVSRRLRRDLPDVKCITVQPASPLHGLEGTRHLPSSIVPRIYDPSLVSENIWIETEDAYEMVRRLAREEGLLVGISAAANVLAATRMAERLSKEGEHATLVTVLCDGGQKYLSESFWND
ncbi:MAG TPA: cysteine synthase family protein [Bryobacteraceae bacterium]|nr:cysteine synthase family protein [Bryobacteraceae bacterium]